MSFSSSYLQLDGVEFKISDAVNPPSLPELPKNFKINDVSKLLSESKFDFSLETSVLAKISAARDADRKMAEQEQQRRMLSIKRRADAEKRRLEEMMTQQREVLQRKREEFLEQKRKRQLKKHNADSSPESASPVEDAATSSNVPPTYENVKMPPPVPSRGIFSTSQNEILTPQPVVGEKQDSSSKLNPSQPVVSGQNQIWEDFEDKELDPFTNAELKTIDDLAELQAVLQNARIGQDFSTTSVGNTSKVDGNEDPANRNHTENNEVILDSASPSSDNSPENHLQTTAPLYENVSLEDVKTVAAKLENQNASSLTRMQKTHKGTQLESFPLSAKNKAEKEVASGKFSPESEPVYSKVRKNHIASSNNTRPELVHTGYNPSNPFLNSFTELGTATTTGNPLPSDFYTSVQQPPGNSPSVDIPVNHSALFASMFNPVPTGFIPSSSTVAANSNSGSSSPVFSRASLPYSGASNPVPNEAPHSEAPKVLPISFGVPNNVLNTPTSQAVSKTPTSSTGPRNNVPARTAPKPPVPAPRKPAVPQRCPNPTSTEQNGAGKSMVQNGPTKGRSHLLPPYSLPSNMNETNSTAPSTGSGIIHQSQQDRAKFFETVNKALSSLPQNPAPVKKKPEPPVNQEIQRPLVVVRTLSLKSSLINGLTSEEQAFVKNMMSMGFEGEATVRAMQRYGIDDKEVVDHLIQVQGIMEQGYSSTAVQDALEMFPKDGKSVVKYLMKLQQLTDMGFPEDKVRDALKLHNNDQAAALDQLMEAT